MAVQRPAGAPAERAASGCSMMVRVDDADQYYARAVECGARITRPPTTPTASGNTLPKTRAAFDGPSRRRLAMWTRRRGAVFLYDESAKQELRKDCPARSGYAWGIWRATQASKSGSINGLRSSSVAPLRSSAASSTVLAVKITIGPRYSSERRKCSSTS